MVDNVRQTYTGRHQKDAGRDILQEDGAEAEAPQIPEGGQGPGRSLREF